MRLTSALLLLATPAAAQDPGIEERMNACLAGIDVDAIGVRAEAFAAARGYDARVAEFCGAGDRDGAAAFAAKVEADFYARDAEAARMRGCVAEALGHDDFDTAHVCDE
jgi:hypothetical protein